jgi:hypothetical protein
MTSTRTAASLVRRVGFTLSTVVLLMMPGSAAQKAEPYRTFRTPEEAVKALIAAAKGDGMDELLSMFGPEASDLVASSDPATTRRNREVFRVAAAERWSFEDKSSDTKVLIIGNEAWPFPVPLVKAPEGWRFDTTAGREEVLARRIGRNELAAIRICRTYVAAQRIYATTGHDGQPPGLYARTIRSDTGRQNGLYWPAARGQKRSPLGDLVAQAAAEGRPVGEGAQPAPFHGYVFRILTAQGPKAPGGAKNYVVDGRMSGGFALVAWPAEYGVTGVMTFIVSQDASLREKNLGPQTATIAAAMASYDPDDSWEVVPETAVTLER